MLIPGGIKTQSNKKTIKLHIKSSCSYLAVMGKQNNTENLVKSNLDLPNKGVPVDEKDCGGCREGSEVLGGEIVGNLWWWSWPSW